MGDDVREVARQHQPARPLRRDLDRRLGEALEAVNPRRGAVGDDGVVAAGCGHRRETVVPGMGRAVGEGEHAGDWFAQVALFERSSHIAGAESD